ncbi:hypothetical protein SAMN04490197_0961 [Pseudomonas orientalis]|uniref:Uncharacterized protein n=1 Tax=Pseudomonas orientalis TaxID=76758 RepID=A0A8B3XTD8_9PSED|nr:hypothetical protein SAMN04490197_0961 [Pseudomonas orientalis]
MYLCTDSRGSPLILPRKWSSPSVGASLLAKNVNDNACFLSERGGCEFFASKLAPTEDLD